ncbi:hypothetical protein [Caballeronia sp. LZ019]|uniref:hypothetical protein n=1 Tax=Caballeronia sp. LZ019 TaxID=3038555 RepID=UPI0028578DF2|nr:hypothetical protein [Caballeronia sp. LZ019]MDR5811274.1 hypothetical protein [Caballeronia sp. LZ019]
MASPEQQHTIIEWFRLALDWTNGRIGSEAIRRSFGQPEQDDVVGNTRSQDYFPDFASISFESTVTSDTPTSFTLKVEPALDTNIPKESFESYLGLRRAVRGEIIDGRREEKNQFFNPNVVPNGNPDLVTLIYRVPQSPDSHFEVYVSIDYLGLNAHDGPDFKNLQSAVNLRQIAIHRRPLTPDELEQRNQAKRQKYGYMNLRSGMLCPETGWWEGWTTLNEIDKQVVRAGSNFPQAVLGAGRSGPDGARFADAQWMWRGLYRETS